MNSFLPRLLTLLLALTGPASADRHSTSISIHPLSLGYVVFNGTWLSVTLEQQVSSSFSMVVRPTLYRHAYTTHSEGWFGSESDTRTEIESHAIYLGPRLYMGEGKKRLFFQALAKQSSESFEESLDGWGHYRQKAIGGLIYTGIRSQGKTFQTEWNFGWGRNFKHYDRDVTGDVQGLWPVDVLFDMNFTVGFHT